MNMGDAASFENKMARLEVNKAYLRPKNPNSPFEPLLQGFLSH
jgi:hypothetical protein